MTRCPSVLSRSPFPIPYHIPHLPKGTHEMDAVHHDTLGLAHNAGVQRTLRDAGEPPDVMFSARAAVAVVPPTDQHVKAELQGAVLLATPQSMWFTSSTGKTLVRVFFIEVVRVVRYTEPPLVCVHADHWGSEVRVLLQCEHIALFADLLLGRLSLEIDVCVRRKLSDDGVSVDHTAVPQHSYAGTSQMQEAGVKPKAVEGGSGGSDPETGLPIVPLPADVVRLHPVLAKSTVHHIEDVMKVSSKGRQQRRLLVITSTSFYMCDLSRGRRGVTRCTDIVRIAQVFAHSSGQSGVMALKVPYDGFDSVFRSSKHEAICNILTTISRVRHGRTLLVTPWDLTEVKGVSMGAFSVNEVQFLLQKPSEYRVRQHSPDIERAAVEDLYGAPRHHHHAKAAAFNAQHALSLQRSASQDGVRRVHSGSSYMGTAASSQSATESETRETDSQSDALLAEHHQQHQQYITERTSYSATLPQGDDNFLQYTHMGAEEQASVTEDTPPPPEMEGESERSMAMPAQDYQGGGALAALSLREDVLEVLRVAAVLLMEGQHAPLARFLTSCASVVQDASADTAQLQGMAAEAVAMVHHMPPPASSSPSRSPSPRAETPNSSVPPSEDPPEDDVDYTLRATEVAVVMPLQQQHAPPPPPPPPPPTLTASTQTELVEPSPQGELPEEEGEEEEEEIPAQSYTPAQTQTDVAEGCDQGCGPATPLATPAEEVLCTPPQSPTSAPRLPSGSPAASGVVSCEGVVMVAWDVCATWHSMELVLLESVLCCVVKGRRQVLVRLMDVVRLETRAHLPHATLPPSRSRRPGAIALTCRNTQRYYLVFDLPEEQLVWAKALATAIGGDHTEALTPSPAKGIRPI